MVLRRPNARPQRQLCFRIVANSYHAQTHKKLDKYWFNGQRLVIQNSSNKSKKTRKHSRISQDLFNFGSDHTHFVQCLDAWTTNINMSSSLLIMLYRIMPSDSQYLTIIQLRLPITSKMYHPPPCSQNALQEETQAAQRPPKGNPWTRHLEEPSKCWVGGSALSL